MKWAMIIVLLYGIFSIAGGLIGFFKAGSTASLIAGLSAGVILILSAYGISKNILTAAVISVILACILGGRFLLTILKNFKVMPDLIMIIFSLATIVVVFSYLLRK